MINIGFDENTAIDEFILDIRDKKQVIKARYALNTNDKEKNVIMSEHYIELSFELDSYVRFVRSDYIIWEGERYILKEKYKPNQENTSKYKYTLRFDHWTTLLQEATFYYLNQDMEEVEWKLTSNAATFFQLIADNANRYFGFNTFNVGTIEFSEIKFIQFDKTNVWDAATQVADAYKGEWYLSDTTFHLVKKFSFGSEIEFLTDVSIEKMDRSEGENANNLTRIVALGSTRNIPTNYRQPTSGESVDAVFQKRLRIPAEKGNVIDALPNMSPEEAIEGVVIFEDIFPQRIGTMSNVTVSPQTDTNTDTGVVTKWNAFRFKDIGLQFKKEYLLPSVELRIIFQSGNLNGMDFAVKFNPEGLSETNPDAQVFEIVRNETYGRPLPNDTLKPQNGDTYILYGFNIKMVSDIYVPAGEQELYDTAVDWLIDNNKDKSVYECFTMIQHFEDHEMDLEIGQKVKLIHDQFEGGFRSSRIQGYEKYLINKYQATYTIGDNAAYSWAIQVNETIQELQIAGISFQATGGNGVYLITQFDNTPPSDFNAYSAVASNARYLNRQTGGTVQGNTTFQQDVSIQGKAISDQFGNSTFTGGQFGSGFKMWKAANGQSYAEFDNLLVRREMIVNVLTIAEIRSVGGQILVSVANMTASAVSDGGTYWKVSFDTADGTIPNYFAVDDQVICRRWTGTNIVYYWAKAISIGPDYINVSKTDKDGSGIPSIGDEIIQFGNRTNTARQSAIIISAYGSDAPSIKQYSGINSYDLTGKEVTVISPLGNKFTGNFIIQNTGKSISETIDAIQIGGRNFLQQSRLNSVAGWSLTGGTPSVYADPNFGNVIRWERTSGSGGFQKTFAINKAELSNTDVVYYVIARRSTGSFQFGGWTETSGYLHSDTANKIDLGNGWVQYWRTFRSGADIASGSTFGINTVTGAWLFFAAGVLKGNKPLDWTIAPEDTQALINNAQNTADNAVIQVSEAKSSITVLNNQIASKVEQADFNSLKGRVSDAESSIIQNANSITSTVTKVEAKSSIYRSLTSSNTDRPKVPYSKDDMWITYEGAIRQSTTTRLSGLFIDSDWVLSTKYIDESAISAIQVGGRNYVRDSKLITLDSGANQYNFKPLVQSEALISNTQYTISIGKTEITSGAATTQFAIRAYNFTTGLVNGSDVIFPISTDRKSVTFTTGSLPDNSYTLIMYAGIAGAAANRAMRWSEVQLEKGNKATSWSVAPEDTQTLINNAQNTADTKNRLYYQDLQPTTPSGGFREGDMWYKASLVDFDGNINANVALNKYQLQQRWNGSTWVKVNWSASRSWVKQTDDQIISVVEKTGINGLGAGETLKSLIDQTPSKIELAVSSIQIGAVNTFAKTTDVFPVLSDGLHGQVLNRNNNGFEFITNQTTHPNEVRISNVIKSNGWYTLSGFIKTNQPHFTNISIQFADVVVKTIPANSTEQYFSVSYNVANYTPNAYNFIDITCFDWIIYSFRDLKIEQGNKATSWSAAPSDVNDSIAVAQTTANNAATAAETAQTSATNANSLLSDIANDNKLDPSEKQSTLKEWNIIQSEYTRNVAQASSFTVSSAAYTTAYNSLSSYITPLLSNMNITSDIVGTTFRATFKAYYDARTDLLNAIATKAKTLANTAQTTADSKTTADEVKSSFTVTDNKISLLSKTIELKGTTIAKAIQAEELNVGKFRVATDGKIYATDGEFSGKISATSGSIAGFSISDGKIGSEFNQNGLGLFSSSIKFVGSNVLAAIGENVLPGSSGLTAVARFENSQTNSGGTNYGIIANVSGAATNIALALSGMVSGLSLYTRRVNSNTTLTNTDVFISCLSGLSITLPANPDIGKIFKIFRQTTSQITLLGNGKSIYSKGNLVTSFQMGSISVTTGSSGSFVSEIWSCDLVYDGVYWNITIAESPKSTT